MYGAIAGDFIGSAHEFKDRLKTTKFTLITDRCKFTDDSVMTVATADAILNNKSFTEAYLEWGHKYPDAGYGGKFRGWLASSDPQPYGSFGNGSAMRVSPCAWAAKSLDEAEQLAEKSALPTHNTVEGIKGAKATAAAIYLARSERNADSIRKYLEDKFGYNLHRTIEQIRPGYKFNGTCQGSVPEAIICFLEGGGYEQVVRKAVSLGGDSDTQAAIAGSIAEAYYSGVPETILAHLKKVLPSDMVYIMDMFYNKYYVK